jgi:hypothetical protein
MQSMPTITASEKNLTNDSGIMILLNENTNSDKITTMNIADILAKKPADRTEEEVKFLQEATELTDDQKAQLETEKTEAEAAANADADADKGEGDEDKDGDEGEDKDDAEEGDESEADKEAANKDVTVKAGELERLKKLEADHKAAESLKAAEDFSTPFLKSADAKSCKVKPAGKTALVQLAQSLNESQRQLLASVLNATSDTKIEGAVGEDNKEGLTATEQYNNLISGYQKEGKSPAEANKLVRKNHEAIYKAYVAENK